MFRPPSQKNLLERSKENAKLTVITPRPEGSINVKLYTFLLRDKKMEDHSYVMGILYGAFWNALGNRVKMSALMQLLGVTSTSLLNLFYADELIKIHNSSPLSVSVRRKLALNLLAAALMTNSLGLLLADYKYANYIIPFVVAEITDFTRSARVVAFISPLAKNFSSWWNRQPSIDNNKRNIESEDTAASLPGHNSKHS